MKVRRLVEGALGLILSAAIGLGIEQAQDFPSKPITVIIPLGAGGSHDLNARVFTSVLPEYLGQPVVVKLMPGASGQTGTAAAAEATADGHTLLFSHNYFDQLQQHVADLPLEPSGDFVTVVRLNLAPASIVVRSDSQWQTLEELFEFGRQNPGELNFGHSGQWGAIMVPGARLLNEAGVVANFTPFQGGGPTVRALIAGDVDFSMMFPSVIEAQGDNLRVLASAGDERLFPDVPTFRELGFESDIGTMNRIVLAPRGIPDDSLAALREAFAKLQEDRTYTRLMARLGEDPSTFLDGAAYEELRPQQSEAFKTLVESITGGN